MAEKSVKFIIDAQNKADKAFKDVEKNLDSVQGKLKKMEPAFKKMAMVGTAGFAAISGAIVLATKNYIEAGDQIHKMGLRTGFTSEALSELRYAAQISGTSIEGLEVGIKRMSRFVLDAERGLSQSTRTLDTLGVSVSDIQGLSPEDMFWRLANAVGEVEDPLIRAGVAQEIFGRSGTALLPLLAQGEEGMRRLREETHDLGIVFDEDAAGSAAELRDMMTKLRGSFQGVQYALAEVFIPTIKDLLDKITPIVISISEWMKENSALAKLIIVVTAALFGLIGAIGMLGLVSLKMSIAIGALSKSFIGLKFAMIKTKIAALGLMAVPIIAFITAIGVLVGYVIYEFYKASKELGGFKNTAMIVFLYVKLAFLNLIEAILSGLSKIPLIGKTVEDTLHNIRLATIRTNREFNKLAVEGIEKSGQEGNKMGYDMTSVLKDLEQSVRDTTDTFGTSIDTTKDKYSELKKEIESINEEMVNTTKRFLDEKEEDEISFRDNVAKKVAEYELEVDKLRKEATLEEKAHNYERASDLINKIATIQDELREFYSWDMDLSDEVSWHKKLLQAGELERMYLEYKERERLRIEEYAETMTLLALQKAEREKAAQEELKLIETTKDAHVEAEKEKTRVTISEIQARAEAYSRSSGIGGSLFGSQYFRPQSVQDAVITPQGQVIQTDPADWLFATKNPSALAGGITVNINGGTYLSEEVAEDIGDKIINKLKRIIKL
jgi:xanthosine utilization system XapX-like protein